MCTWRCEHARFVWRVFIRYIDIFIHAFQTKKEEKKEEGERGGEGRGGGGGGGQTLRNSLSRAMT